MVAARNTVHDFMRRTEANLKLIEEGASREQSRHFEVTQLINSAIGLLMFPSEELLDRLPRRKMSEFSDTSLPKVLYGRYKGEDDPDLQTLVRYLRNSIAHYNVQFVNHNNIIQGLYVWNRPHHEKPDWIAYVSIDTLRSLFKRLCSVFKDVSEKEQEPDVLADKVSALEQELAEELGGQSLRLTNVQSLQ